MAQVIGKARRHRVRGRLRRSRVVRAVCTGPSKDQAKPSWVRRNGLRLLAGLAAAVAVVVALRGRIPDPAEVASVLAAANVGWLATAVVVQFLSQVAFARQQRALLAALSVEISRRDALAITYSRSAMSMVLPAGSAMSAAFALRQYKRRGASTAVAATAMVLSAAASVLGLGLLYAGTVGVPTWVHLVAEHVIPAVVIAAALVAAGLAAYWRAVTHRSAAVVRAARHLRWGWADRLLGHLRGILAEARTVRVRDWALTISYAVLNWLLDLCCLVAVAQACDLELGVFQLATVYLAVQVVRQIPLTPGGVGLIEASLLTGFVAVGTPQAVAAAVVLGYRIVSFWLVLPAGLFAYLRVNRGGAGERPAVVTPS
ncbi:YbhN family protein [Actinoplanes sp. NPDC051494]|uniref:YbhN family protein n=1 Tax=Actinoplanes sp. NPDC051494 TaxID=3363907 RepID=UPI0037B13542